MEKYLRSNYKEVLLFISLLNEKKDAQNIARRIFRLLSRKPRIPFNVLSMKFVFFISIIIFF